MWPLLVAALFLIKTEIAASWGMGSRKIYIKWKSEFLLKFRLLHILQKVIFLEGRRHKPKRVSFMSYYGVTKATYSHTTKRAMKVPILLRTMRANPNSYSRTNKSTATLFNSKFTSITFELHYQYGKNTLLRWVNDITLHLERFKWSLFLAHQWKMLSRSCCNFESNFKESSNIWSLRHTRGSHVWLGDVGSC